MGKDPEMQTLEGGIAVAKFSLATTEGYRDKEGKMQQDTEWHNIVAWRSVAELAGKYIRKGSHIFWRGR